MPSMPMSTPLGVIARLLWQLTLPMPTGRITCSPTTTILCEYLFLISSMRRDHLNFDIDPVVLVSGTTTSSCVSGYSLAQMMRSVPQQEHNIGLIGWIGPLNQIGHNGKLVIRYAPWPTFTYRMQLLRKRYKPLLLFSLNIWVCDLSPTKPLSTDGRILSKVPRWIHLPDSSRCWSHGKEQWW